MSPESRKKPPPESVAEREARIDETLEATFPASDPPKWGTGADDDEEESA